MSGVEDWDGQPKVVLTWAQSEALLDFVPGWHACIRGPVPLGGSDPLQLTLDGIISPTREEAERVCWLRCREMCEAYRVEFDEEAWKIEHILPTNQC